MTRRPSAQEMLPRPVRAVVIGVLSLFVIVPIAYLLLLSVTPDAEAGKQLVPSHFAWGNYFSMWGTVNLLSGLPSCSRWAGAT